MCSVKDRLHSRIALRTTSPLQLLLAELKGPSENQDWGTLRTRRSQPLGSEVVEFEVGVCHLSGDFYHGLIMSLKSSYKGKIGADDRHRCPWGKD